MSDRDVIAAHRLEAHAGWKAGTAGFRAWCTCGWHSDQVLPDSEVWPGYKSLVGESWHDDHVADALRESRTVRTVEELDALPVGSIVVEPVGHAWIKHDPALWHCSCDGTDAEWASSLLVQDSHLPLQVVYRPVEDGAL